ncbi:MAG TPA: cell division protein ZapA [Clostridiales bacterium]|nr:cell division protein ZapA [Clostridiales bacterium]
MKNANNAEVIINNKRYLIRGYESEEHIQRIASYINSKHSELKGKDAYRLIDSDTRNTLIQINIGNDYFKALDNTKELNKKIEEKNQEIYDLKHEILSLKVKTDENQKENKELKQQINDLKKQRNK